MRLMRRKGGSREKGTRPIPAGDPKGEHMFKLKRTAKNETDVTWIQQSAVTNEQHLFAGATLAPSLANLLARAGRLVEK